MPSALLTILAGFSIPTLILLVVLPSAPPLVDDLLGMDKRNSAVLLPGQSVPGAKAGQIRGHFEVRITISIGRIGHERK